MASSCVISPTFQVIALGVRHHALDMDDVDVRYYEGLKGLKFW